LNTQAETEKYKLNLYCDESAENPRNWENAGTMVCWHRKYALGDKHDFTDVRDFLDSPEAKSAYIILPVFLYDHRYQKLSNQSFLGRAQHAEWDSGQVGWIYVSEEKAKEIFCFEPTEENKAAVTERLQEETEIYSDYLEGNCYGYSIEDSNGEQIDCCGGFYGENLNEVLQQMTQQAGLEYESLFNKMQSYERALHHVMT
jgi:hypothetical protein